MKFLKSLLGEKQLEKPKWDIKSPTQRPAAKPRVGAEEPDSSRSKNAAESIWDDPLDTLQLQQDDDVNDDNPYQTFGWEMDPENDTRRLKTIQIGEKTDKAVGSQNNPYDTGSMRRGWKK